MRRVLALTGVVAIVSACATLPGVFGQVSQQPLPARSELPRTIDISGPWKYTDDAGIQQNWVITDSSGPSDWTVTSNITGSATDPKNDSVRYQLSGTRTGYEVHFTSTMISTIPFPPTKYVATVSADNQRISGTFPVPGSATSKIAFYLTR